MGINMADHSFVKLVLLSIFLLITNPDRAELDNRLVESFKYQGFVKGISQYFRVNLREAFSARGDSSVNCLIFSYLDSGKGGTYIGVSGFWIDPHYWSTICGWITLGILLLSLWRIYTIGKYGDLLNLFLAVAPFIFFAEVAEAKLGERMLLFLLASCAAASTALWSVTKKQVTSLQNIPWNQFLRSMSSAFLCYLARAATSPKKSYILDGIVIERTFRWHGMNIDYAQAAMAGIAIQTINADFVALVGSFIGYIFRDVVEWISNS